MRMAWACLLLCLGAAGCVSDLELRSLDARGNVARTFMEGEALSIESDGRRRVLLRSSPIDRDETAQGQSVLMYLSIPLDPVHGPDFGGTRAFVVWSDISAEFAGFVRPVSGGRAGENLRGTYTGTLREPDSGRLRIVEVDVLNAPIRRVETREEIDLLGFSETIQEHLYRLEFDAAERKYWRAGEKAPAGPAAPEEGPESREHD